ncbi:hypothetical protein ACK3TF_005262 [Chlorella vulgaris]
MAHKAHEFYSTWGKATTVHGLANVDEAETAMSRFTGVKSGAVFVVEGCRRPHISRAVSTPAEAGYEWDSMDREQRECAKAFLREPTNTKPQKKPKLSTQANKRLGMKGWPRRQLQQQEQGSSSDEEISEMSDG